tara:strand:+ start:3123 stop:3812 length:690 start_codon:yes stop_codon:yes gene_type:complete
MPNFTNDYYQIIKFINKYPNMFTIVQYKGGHAGNLLYRAICATDNKFLWLNYFASADWEDDSNKKPLDWPRKTEGYNIYNVSSSSFREDHATTSHISVIILEAMDINIFQYYVKMCVQNNKSLLIRTHNTDIHKIVTKALIIRICRSLSHLTKTGVKYTMKNQNSVSAVIADNIHNIDNYNFLSYDYNKFLNEYLALCARLKVMPNISNVRAYVLLWLERLNRFNNDLP